MVRLGEIGRTENIHCKKSNVYFNLMSFVYTHFLFSVPQQLRGKVFIAYSKRSVFKSPPSYVNIFCDTSVSCVTKCAQVDQSLKWCSEYATTSGYTKVLGLNPQLLVKQSRNSFLWRFQVVIDITTPWAPVIADCSYIIE